jgi:hypothetical protein
MSQKDFADVEQADVEQYDAELDETFVCEGCKHEQDCTAVDGWILHQQIEVCLAAGEPKYKAEADWINELYGTETADKSDPEIDMSDDARPSNEMMEHYKRGGR